VFNCGPKSPTDSGETGFAVHEWGVLVGCSGEPTGFITSRPEYAAMAREPVIYFHKQDKTPFSVRAVFRQGEPTMTYPAAQIAGDTVIWDRVDYEPWTRSGAGLDTSNFVPLEDIIDELNDVDADLLYIGGYSARFLFYEGMMPSITSVVTTLLDDDSSLVLQNTGDYTVYDITYSAVTGQLSPFLPTTGYVDSLAAGQTDTIHIIYGQTVSFQGQLERLGFTEAEAGAFEILWETSFYESASSVAAAGNLIYRIPQSVYDGLISLEVDPQPEEIIRTLYVLNHIYDN